jgi:ParB family chromosome partitioning protein
MAEKRLGRGLDFLISRTSAPPPAPVVQAPAAAPAPKEPPGPRVVPLEAISANPFQPRREFEPGALADLEASIREHGVLQPIVLRPAGATFQLVAGERRFRAAKNVGLPGIPAVIRAVSDDQMLALALVENIQRENLNPIETALAYRDLLAAPDLTQEVVARLVGKSRVSIANTLRLLDLPAAIQEHVSRGTLSAGHGRALLMCADTAAMEVLAQRIMEEGLSVREAEALAGGAPGAAPSDAPTLITPHEPKQRSSHLDELEDRLRTALGTRVIVKPGRGKRGKIVLYYASLEDFDRLFEILTGADQAPAAKAVG